MATLRVATRGSELALWQARLVVGCLACEAELVVVSVRGDRDKSSPLSQLAGQGVFSKEVQLAVFDGRADIAVHAAKDLPSRPELAVPNLVIGAVLERDDPRDVLVGRPLGELAAGAEVATGSARRAMLVRCLRPDLRIIELRGNVPTRLDKVPPGGAIVTALAALKRLGREDLVAEIFDPATFVPQVGQGAIVVECRQDDERTLSMVTGLDHAPTRLEVEAERAWLRAIAGSCEAPVGAHAVFDGDEIRLSAVLGHDGGPGVTRGQLMGVTPEEIGTELAEQMLRLRE